MQYWHLLEGNLEVCVQIAPVVCRLQGLLAQVPASTHHTHLISQRTLLGLCVRNTIFSMSSLSVKLMALQLQSLQRPRLKGQLS